MSVGRNVTSANSTGNASDGMVYVTSWAAWGYTEKMRIGVSSCEVTSWVSDTSVRCQPVAALRGSHRVVMTVGSTIGSMTEAVSADVAVVSTLMKSNAAGTGSSSITVQGVGFGLVGYSSQVRQGSTGCEATGWESETSVRCHVSVGMRGTRRVMMTAGEQGGSITEAWSMDRSEMSVVRR